MNAEIKKFVLRRLLQRHGEPVSAEAIKLAIRSAFGGNLLDGELDTLLAEMKDADLVAISKDDFESVVIGFAPKGKIASELLVKL